MDRCNLTFKTDELLRLDMLLHNHERLFNERDFENYKISLGSQFRYIL